MHRFTQDEILTACTCIIDIAPIKSIHSLGLTCQCLLSELQHKKRRVLKQYMRDSEFLPYINDEVYPGMYWNRRITPEVFKSITPYNIPIYGRYSSAAPRHIIWCQCAQKKADVYNLIKMKHLCNFAYYYHGPAVIADHDLWMFPDITRIHTDAPVIAHLAPPTVPAALIVMIRHLPIKDTICLYGVSRALLMTLRHEVKQRFPISNIIFDPWKCVRAKFTCNVLDSRYIGVNFHSEINGTFVICGVKLIDVRKSWMCEEPIVSRYRNTFRPDGETHILYGHNISRITMCLHSDSAYINPENIHIYTLKY